MLYTKDTYKITGETLQNFYKISCKANKTIRLFLTLGTKTEGI